MRILLSLLILTLIFQSSTKADDIKDFEIEGFTLFENLLDHSDKLNLSKDDILNKKLKFYPNSKRIGLLRFSNVEGFEIYDDIQFAVDSKTYKIYTIFGILNKFDTKEKCSKKQNEIIESLHKIAPSAQKVVEDYSQHPADKSGDSISSGIYLDFDNGHSLSAECYIWGENFKNNGYTNNLKINIESREGRLFVQNEAYK
ncbi:hypothetical protein N9U24_01365 [Candidatus Pelagibacter sp.]|nr:hypothetical protein [Candidatus Pelagibacter sp.]